MIDRGATTIWEHWEGIDDDGVAHASLNHYSKGAVISFLHRYVAGIQLLDDATRVSPLPHRAASRRRPHLGERRTRVALRPHRVVVVDRRNGHDVHGAGAAEHRSRGGAARRAHGRGRSRPGDVQGELANERVDVVEGAAFADDDHGAAGAAATRTCAVHAGSGETAVSTVAVAAGWPRPIAS